ncbi:hypothetical protein CKK34_2147 [Yarrowia sp. E02]|nr:hypothetical protein CKK34_2147 [Yarrowia sp. E02]
MKVEICGEDNKVTFYKSTRKDWVPDAPDGEYVWDVMCYPKILNVTGTTWPQVYSTIRDTKQLWGYTKERMISQIKTLNQEKNLLADKKKFLEVLKCHLEGSLNGYSKLIHKKKLLQERVLHLNQVWDMKEKLFCKSLESLDESIGRLSRNIQSHIVNVENYTKQLDTLLFPLKQVFSDHPEMVDYIVGLIKGESVDHSRLDFFASQSLVVSRPSSDTGSESESLFVPSSNAPATCLDPSVESVLDTQLERLKQKRQDVCTESQGLQVDMFTESYYYANLHLKHLEMESLRQEGCLEARNHFQKGAFKPTAKEERLKLADKHIHLQKKSFSNSSLCLPSKGGQKTTAQHQNQFVGKEIDKRNLMQGSGFFDFLEFVKTKTLKNVVGPLRSYIGFAPNVSDDLKHLVLTFLKDHLTTFLAENETDYCDLERRKAKLRARNVTIAVYSDEGHREPRSSGQGWTSVYDLLTFTDSHVKNYLLCKLDLDSIAVSSLKFSSEKQLFFDPWSGLEVGGKEHIERKTLIISPDFRYMLTCRVPSQHEFDEKAEFLDLRLLKVFEDPVEAEARARRQAILVQNEVEAQREQCGKKKQRLSLATKSFCEENERISKMEYSIEGLPELKNKCVKLHRDIGTQQKQQGWLETSQTQLKSLKEERAEVQLQKKREMAKCKEEYNGEKATLKRLLNNNELSKAEKLSQESQDRVARYQANHTVNFTLEAKKYSQDSIKNELENTTQDLESITHQLQVTEKLHKEHYIPTDHIISYFDEQGIKIDPDRFDASKAAAAISHVINKMKSPTVFVNGDIEVHSDKQLMVVGQHGDLVDLT